jgi:hypothetical protein
MEREREKRPHQSSSRAILKRWTRGNPIDDQLPLHPSAAKGSTRVCCRFRFWWSKIYAQAGLLNAVPSRNINELVLLCLSFSFLQYYIDSKAARSSSLIIYANGTVCCCCYCYSIIMRIILNCPRCTFLLPVFIAVWNKIIKTHQWPKNDGCCCVDRSDDELLYTAAPLSMVNQTIFRFSLSLVQFDLDCY